MKRVLIFNFFLFALVFSLTSKTASSIDDSSSIKLTETTFLGATAPLNWNFSICGSDTDPLKVKSVHMSILPVRSQEFFVYLVYSHIFSGIHI